MNRRIPSTLLALFLLGAAIAGAADFNQPVKFDIGAQPLDTALLRFSEQAGIQVLVPTVSISGKKTAGIRGEHIAEQALAALLKDSGLTYTQINPRTVAIRFPGKQTSDIPLTLKFARADADRVAAQGGGNAIRGGGPATESADAVADEQGIPELLVKGSRMLNMDIRRTPDDIQPYVIFDRDAIARSGASSLEDLLKSRLTMNTQGLSYDQDPLAGGQGARSQINLRGLGTNQTLILIDGRRAANAYFLGGPAQPDVNGIPLAAVERVEILPSTASGIYGGSATGGVINIIMRRDYNSIEAKVSYENTFDTDASRRRLDFSSGFSLEGGKTHVLLAANYSDQGRLAVQDRDVLGRARARILANNPATLLNGATPPIGATTNIRSFAGTPLVLKSGTALNSAITFVPVGYGGASTDAGAALVANAGKYNLGLPASAQLGHMSLLLNPTVEAATATVRREWSPRFHVFLEGAASNNIGHALSYAPLIDSFTIPNTSPINPFTESIRVTVPSASTDIEQTMSSRVRRIAAGLILKLSREWAGELDYTWNFSHSDYSDTGWAPTAAAAVTAGTINVLRDTHLLPVDFQPYVQPFNYTITPFRATLRNTALRLAGPVANLPAGKLMASVLLEHSDQDFDDAYLFQTGTTFYYPTRSRTARSGYAELRWPVIGSRNRIRAVQELELQAAVRHDNYVSNGSGFISNPATPIVRASNRTQSTNPTLGLRYRPFSSVMLRLNYGTGFLPPEVNQLTQNAPLNNATGGVWTDPRRGNEQAGAGGPVQTVSGGNPGLRPEESASWSMGAIFTPALLPRLRFSVDWTQIDKTDSIISLGPQNIINEELNLPGRITRGSVPVGDPYGIGPITRIDISLVNFARVEAETYDLGLQYRIETGAAGVYEVFASATRQLHYKTQLLVLAGRAMAENVGITSRNPLSLKANAGVTWTQGSWTAGWSANYLDDYWVTDPAVAANLPTIRNQGNGGVVPSQTYHDLFGIYRFPDGAAGFASRILSGAELQLGIRNLFDEPPPVDVSGRFFYSVLGDPRGRGYLIAFKRAF